jgi:cytochrome P450
VPSNWSWIFGSLLDLKTIMDRLPTNVHIDCVVRELAEQFIDTDMFYMDIWPMNPQMLVITEPSAAVQAIQKLNLPKPVLFHDAFLPITGGANLFTMMEKPWKPWRAIFNPGFSSAQMMAQVPFVLDACEVFRSLLEARARDGAMFRLEDLTLKLALEVIMKVTL